MTESKLSDGKELAVRSADNRMVEANEGTDAGAFGSFVHSYVWSAIAFAEQKSAFVFAVDSAFVGYLMSTGLIRNLVARSIRDWDPDDWFGIAAIALLTFSMAAILWAVIPRLGGASSGVVYFRSIALRPHAGDYVSEVLGMENVKRTDEILRHVYELASICGRKYKSVRYAMIAAVLGFVSGFIYIALS